MAAPLDATMITIDWSSIAIKTFALLFAIVGFFLRELYMTLKDQGKKQVVDSERITAVETLATTMKESIKEANGKLDRLVDHLLENH